MAISKKKAGIALTTVCCMTLAASCITLGCGLSAYAEEGYTVNTAVAAKKALYETKDSPELIKNGDFKIQDFADEGCGWKDWAWGGFDGEKGKITSYWHLDYPGEGHPIGFYQDIAVEPNTYYYVKFSASLGGDQNDLYVGLIEQVGTPWESDAEIPYLEGQGCTISTVTGVASDYYVAFHSGANETVRLLFGTRTHKVSQIFGGFFIDDVSMKKITGEAEPTLDVNVFLAEGQKNYVYLGKEGNTTQLAAEVDSFEAMGLKAEDIAWEYSTTAASEIATVSKSGLVTAGTKHGPVVVTAKATATVNGKEISGQGTIRLRVIEPTSKNVLLDVEDADLPMTTTGNSLLKNGDFSETIDTTTTDHTIKAENWRSIFGTWTNTSHADGADAYAGMFEGDQQTHGGKITWRWGELQEDENPGLYQDVAVKANTLYELSFYAYNWWNTPKGHTNMMIGYRNPNAEDIWHAEQMYTVATPDIKTGNFAARENYTKITVYLYSADLTELRVFVYGIAQANQVGDGGGWWMDNFTMKEVSAPKAGVKVTDLDTNIPSTMTNGAQLDLKSFAVYEYGFRKDITASFTPTITSADSSVVAVENGKLVAKKEGTVKVTVSGTYEGMNLSEEYTVKVTPVPRTLEVKVGSDNTINEGRDQKITVTVTYSDGTSETLSNAKLTVSDDAIISQKGNTMYLAGKAAGKATLTATATVGGVELTGSVEVTVVGEAQEEPAKKGCGSDVMAGGIVGGIGIAAVALGATVVAVAKKKKTK